MEYIKNKLYLTYSIYNNINMINTTLNRTDFLNKYNPIKLLNYNNFNEYIIKPNNDNIFPISSELRNKFNNKYYIYKLKINCKYNINKQFIHPCNCFKKIINNNVIELYLLPSYYDEDYIMIHLLNDLDDVIDITLTLKYYEDKIYIVSYFNKIIFCSDDINENKETITKKFTNYCNKDRQYCFNKKFNVDITYYESDYWKNIVEVIGNLNIEFAERIDNEQYKEIIARLIEKNSKNIINILSN